MALKLLPEDLSDVPAHLADRYEAQAGRYWDLFYRRNSTKFFKDRHYLHKEFPDLAAGPATLLEVGCGVGNTVFPLLEVNPALKIYCCDFAASAIDLVRQNPQYIASGGAVQAFVADITSDLLAAPPSRGGCGVPQGGCDLATMIFVLSAIHPHRMAAAVHNVARCLRPGSGRLLFRDYAEGDLAQERLAGGDRPKRLGRNFYVRGDGTRCYYFSEPEVLALFASAGFTCDSLALHERTVVNHKRDITMDRRWLQAIFTLRAQQPPPLPLRDLLAQTPPLCQQQLHNHQNHQLGLPSAAPGSAAPGSSQSRGTLVDGSGGRSSSDGGGGSDDRMVVDAGSSSRLAAASPAGAAVEAPSSSSSYSSPPTSSSLHVPPSGLYGGSWLTGAAGRLASHLAAGPGQPSGRALLPETLDSADSVRAELSPAPHPPCSHPTHRRRHLGDIPLALSDEPDSGGGAAQERPGGAGGSEGAGGGLLHGGPGEAGNVYGEADMHVDGAAANASGGGLPLESELEAEFFATIGRDSAEVAAEEVAAAGAALSRVRLMDVAEMAAARLAEAAAAASSPASYSAISPHQPLRPQQSQSQQHQPAGSQSSTVEMEVEVEVAAGVSFRCLMQAPPYTAGSAGEGGVPPATLALSRMLMASPRLLVGKCALQLGPARLMVAAAPNRHGTCHSTAAAGVLPAMAAVRGSARRVVVSEPGREGLAEAAADLRRNAHLVVIERLRLVNLDWASAESTALAAAAASGPGTAAGYTYVPYPVRQVRDVLQMHPAGYDLVYAADPLSEVTAAAAGAATSEAAIAAARALFHVAGQLVAAGTAGATAGGPTPGSGPQRPSGGLLLLCVPGSWTAAHGMGFAALAGVFGWELLVPEHLAELYGVDTTAVGVLGCAALAFRRRRADLTGGWRASD